MSSMKQKQEDESFHLREKQQNALLKQQTGVPLTILYLLHKSAKTGRNRFLQNKSGWQMKVHKNEHNWLNKESTCA